MKQAIENKGDILSEKLGFLEDSRYTDSMRKIKRNEEARANFKNIVLPLYNPDWKTPGRRGGLSEEFAEAVKRHVTEFGEYQLWNFLGEADGSVPEWWNSAKVEVRKELF